MRQLPLVEQAMGRQALALLRQTEAACTSADDLAEAAAESFEKHPDAEIITSFPGLGTLSGARVLAEIGDDRSRFADAKGLKAYAGSAPITRASGKSVAVLARRVKNQRLAGVGYMWALAAMSHSDGARAHYDRRREAGDRHTAAQRNLFNRMLGCLHHCLTRRVCYSETVAFPAPSDTPGGHSAPGLFQSDGGLGSEGEVPSQSGLFTAVGVLGPVLLDVEVAVDQAVSQWAGVGAVDRDHGVADLPGRAGVLASHPGGGGALLLLAGLVEDQDRTWGGQMAHGEGADHVPGGFLVPDSLVEQTLHPERPRLPGVLGQGPAVLARQVGQQTAHVRHSVRAWLTAGEQRCQLGAELVELLLEQQGIYADGRGRLIFMLRHNTMINRRPHPRLGTPRATVTPSDHEVRLEYQAEGTAFNG
jgi:hypothetical protein